MNKQKNQKQPTYFCAKCGNPLTGGYSFCQVCGAPVTKPDKAAAGQYLNAPKNAKAGKPQKERRQKQPLAKSAGSEKRRGTFFRTLLRTLKNIAGAILTVLISALLFVLAGMVLIHILGSQIVNVSFIAAFLDTGWVNTIISSVIALIICALICALLIAVDFLLNLHEAKIAFLELSIAFTAASLLLIIFMLTLSERQLCLFISAGLMFAGAVFMLIRSILLVYSRKHIKMLSDLPRPKAYTH